MSPMRLHWDIFCRVIDNFGDIGVCWRLARQLSHEHGLKVRLWVDDLPCLAAICPAVDTTLIEQVVAGVDVRLWRDMTPDVQPADVVIEAFGCELPAAYLQAMAVAADVPRWINLEYLTAETWVDSCHGMVSPHPTLSLKKHFFFPGFTARTGGLIREWHIPGDSGPASRLLGSPLEISLFCYDTVPIDSWLNEIISRNAPVRCHVPPGKPRKAVRACLDGEGPWKFGNVDIQPAPFLPMDDYDTLLARCDINFVRGEDSFVRAQWARAPFVWQIYPQGEDAHLIKLEAFLARYLADASPAVATAVRAMFYAWNTGDSLRSAWSGYLERLPDIADHQIQWRSSLLKQQDLVTSLVKFCLSEV